MKPARSVYLALLLVVLAACGNNGDGDDGGATATGNGTATGGGNGQGPERIVSLSPTATEMLFAIGAGDQVVAVDDQSNYPAEAPTTDLSGFQPNVEAIAEHEPDLVVISNNVDDLVAGLEELDIEVLLQEAPSDFDGIYSQIKELGTATGHEEEAGEVVADMKAEIEGVVSDLPDGVDGMTYYHELDAGLFTVTSATFIGAAYGLMGLENIADAAEDTADGYPKLSAEFIVEADPDLIFLADADFGESLETVSARPGWDAISAVENGAVFPVDADVASRWGPRLVEFIRGVAKQLTELEPSGG